jgi:hypothetical protein
MRSFSICSLMRTRGNSLESFSPFALADMADSQVAEG